MYNGWSNTGPDGIMAEIPERLRNGGWDKVRPAVNVTVRYALFAFSQLLSLIVPSIWIIQGFMLASSSPSPEAGLHLLDGALEVMRWGREAYAEVSYHDKGPVFKKSFIRAVRTVAFSFRMKVSSLLWCAVIRFMRCRRARNPHEKPSWTKSTKRPRR